MAAVLASACFEGTPSPSSLLTYTHQKSNKQVTQPSSELQIKVKSNQEQVYVNYYHYYNYKGQGVNEEQVLAVGFHHLGKVSGPRNRKWIENCSLGRRQ